MLDDGEKAIDEIFIRPKEEKVHEPTAKFLNGILNDVNHSKTQTQLLSKFKFKLMNLFQEKN